MPTRKTTTPSDEDTTRRAFSPLEMDLVERLTREADNRAGNSAAAGPRPSGDANRMAA